ncbi:hypothetical protein M9Y10_043090 [Tritrichomonas musculus]|uniref:UBR-type domain-containing protein n=1 Tax=Tritrichomonas musculus TaxID=1915356 RepID=A0ABR2JYQ8_9EUKA
MNQSPNFKCTFCNNHPEIKTQHLYICKTCNFQEFETICESCAKLCHSGHQIVDLGYTRGYCRCGQGTDACYCFCQNPLPGMLDIPLDQNRQCDFLTHNNEYHRMEAARCSTCSMTGNSCMCIPCTLICHNGHSIYEREEMRAFCDCGDPNQPEHHQHCLITKIRSRDPIPICTSLIFKQAISQPKYFCNTCDPLHEHPICKFCIKVCHQHHDVTEDESTNFTCSCGTRKMNCKCLIISKIEPAS